MTTFTDFIRDKHFDQYEGQEIDRNDDFDTWKENLSNTELSGYFLNYLNTLSEKDYAYV